MKIAMTLLFVAGLSTALSTTARADYAEGFEAFSGAGWTGSNQSSPIGILSYGVTITAAHTGIRSMGVNFNSGAGTATISNWAKLPLQTLNNGDTFSFWAMSPNNASGPDRMQVRMSTNGASNNSGTTATDVGDFTTLLLDINPTYSTSGFPTTFTNFSVTISGLSGPTSGRLAFRYFVENGGPAGANSDSVFFDDIAYTSAPTPASLALLSLGGLVTGRRRPQRSN